MRILILDDEQSRHDVFRRVYAGEIVISCQNYADFTNELLYGSPFDLIHLDHDLGDEESGATCFVDGFGDTVAFTGLHAVDLIYSLPEDKLPARVIVHSNNSVRAPMMVADLKRAGIEAVWEPFSLS